MELRTLGPNAHVPDLSVMDKVIEEIKRRNVVITNAAAICRRGCQKEGLKTFSTEWIWLNGSIWHDGDNIRTNLVIKTG